MFKKIFLASLALLAVMAIPGGEADAATYYYPSYQGQSISSNAQIEALLREVARLQAQLAALQSSHTSGPCYTVGNMEYCYTTQYQYGNAYGYSYNNQNRDDRARSIDVEYRNDAAYIEIEYTNGDDEDFVVAADDDDEVIDYILALTDLPLQNILAVIDFDGDDRDNDDDDVRDIDVEIDRDDNEAEATVRYEDGDRDTFDYNTDDKDEIIEELADDLDMDEDDVEDLIDWEYTDGDDDHNDADDIDSITVEFRNDNAYVEVEWEDGDTDNYTYYNVDEDEDEVLEELSDDLDIDEDDLEDLIDWDY